MDWHLISAAVTSFFAWDGWRAFAAIGTFAAVAVALRRDNNVESSQKLKDAYTIAALIDLIGSLRDQIKDCMKIHEEGKSTENCISIMEKTMIVEKSRDTLSGIKISELPTVEVMTTVSVLRSTVENIAKEIQNLKDGRDADLSVDYIIVRQCVVDLEKEHLFVAGKHYHRSTSDGHRGWRDGKIKKSPRRIALERLGKTLRTIITNKAA